MTLDKMPYVIVADDSFLLSRNCKKPYPQKNVSIAKRLIHYRLSSARRTVENGFGILVGRFRVFHTKISLQPANATKIVVALLNRSEEKISKVKTKRS